MQRSLKARALGWLAQREQSRAELRRKLLPHARAEAAAEMEAASSDLQSVVATRVEALLDWLEAQKYLSQERFVESRIRVRASRFGNLRIRKELQQHQLGLPPAAALALNASELQRASAARERKFAHPPLNPSERARQARFLAARGFSPEVIHRALRNAATPLGSGAEDDAGAD